MKRLIADGGQPEPTIIEFPDAEGVGIEYDGVSAAVVLPEFADRRVVGRAIDELQSVAADEVGRWERHDASETELVADGGTSEYDYAAAKERGHEWLDRAEENIGHWGNQTPAVLLLALAEEIGEVADEVLATGEKPLHDAMYSAEGIHLLSEVRRAGFACRDFLEEHFENEDGAPLPEDEMPRIFHDLDEDRVLDEVDDAAPLLFQLSLALNGRSVDTETELVSDGGEEDESRLPEIDLPGFGEEAEE